MVKLSGAAPLSEAQWCEHAAHLHAIYDFPHFAAAPYQKDATASTLATLFAKFVGQVTWFAEYGCALLAVDGLGQGGDAAGTVDMELVDVRPQPDHVSLHLVAPEGWRFEAHGSPNGAVEHTAKLANPDADPTVWPLGDTIPAADLQRLLGIMDRIITQSRNARVKHNVKGFQRTPAFILEVTTRALKQLWEQDQGAGGLDGSGTSSSVAESRLPQPRGGTTDVGIHTKHDTLRTTCWPLVRAVVQVSLQCMGVCGPQQHPDLLFRRAMAHLDLWLLQRQVRECMTSPAAATPVAVTAAMHMLHATAAKAANLAAEGEDVSAFESACATVRAKLETLAAERAWQAAEQHCVPGEGSSEALGQMQLPAGVLPGLPAAQQVAGGLEAAKQREGRNLGSVPLLQPGASFADVQQLQRTAHWSNPAADAPTQLALRSVERELFTRIRALPGTRGGGSSGSSTRKQLSDEDLAALEAVVDSYRNTLHAFLQTPAAQSAMQSELRSRELLVVWCAYCLAHDSVAQRHPLVREYRAALQFEDLRHLVLSDRQAVDALLAVAAYLHYQRQRGTQPLFSLRDGGSGTFGFAERFAEQDSRLQQILANERQDAAARVDAHWAAVQKQQRELQQARQQLASLETDGKSLRSRLSQVSYNSWEYNSLQGSISRNSSNQNTSKSRISTLKKPPPPVLQPLPAANGAARRWLFFLHMPPAFRSLSCLSFLAQQQLLPHPLDGRSPQLAAVYEDVSVQPPETSVAGHYNQQRACRTYLSYPTQPTDGEDGSVRLHADGKPPENIGPSDIDSYYSTGQGVWYPDDLRPTMLWAGSGCAADSACGFPAYFNPFMPVDAAVVEEYFTERLPGKAAALQWAARQHGTAAATPLDRGNWALADQESCPPGLLSKSEFLQFGRMRAYPLQQLRNLCEVLRQQDQALPLTEPAVQLLLRQMLYHVGPITIPTGGSSNSTQPQLLWRTDWDQPGGVLDALCVELGSLADTLDGKVRDHDAILLLGEVAAYLADWHAPCGALARRFAAITMREADRLQAELDAAAGLAGDDKRVSELLARQVRWRVMALLCYGAGPLAAGAGAGGGQQEQPQQAEDAAVMVRLMVQVCHGLTFQVDAAKLKELQLLRARAHNVMASRAQRLQELIRGRENAVLTAAVAIVLERTPASLPWMHLQFSQMAQQPTAFSYRAQGADGRLYSINILDGTVLFDGCPPSRLPKEITQHQLYLRVFGDFNFEVAFAGGDDAAGQGISSSGGDMLLQTLRKVRGRLYDFRLCAATPGQAHSQLVITEVDVERGGERLELLDAGADSSCRGWGEQLPVRLRELHSHWLSRRHGVLALRPRSFQEHDCAFLAQCLLCSGSPASTSTSSGEPVLRILGNTECAYDIRRVPQHLQSRHWLELLPLVTAADREVWTEAAALRERLVLPHGSRLLDSIFAKFEDARFISTFQNISSGEVSFELPRCGLEFGMQMQQQQQQQLGGGHRAGSSYCQLLSRNYSGYRLRQVQQLVQDASSASGSNGAHVAYTLPEFGQYLVLERIPRPEVAPVGAQRAEVLVLMPAGPVASHMWDGGTSSSTTPGVSITLPERSSGRVNVHCYEVHGRFGHLRAPTRLARLQLAALYAATSTLLPEPGSRCTGAQMAMELLRQCWSIRPLQAPEAEQLAAVGQLGGHLAPGLHLLAHDLAASAAQLAHLHASPATASRLPTPASSKGAGAVGGSAAPGSGRASASVSDAGDRAVMPRLCPDQAHAYTAHWRAAGEGLPPGWGVNSRLLLTPTEAERALGQHLPRRGPPAWRRQGQYKAVGVLEKAPSVPAGFVEDTEKQLRRLVTVPKKRGRTSRSPYPLAALQEEPRPLEVDMHAELRESWKAHHSLPDMAACGVQPDCVDRVQGLKATTTEYRRELEAHLLQQLESVPTTVGCHGTAFRLPRTAAAVAEAGPLDLMRLAVRPELAADFNPFLSPEAAQELRRRVLTWLQLCVLEDRLGRTEALAAAHQAGDDCLPQLVQELGVHRTWDVAAHPEWLVFEVESQLQIRPQQHTVARMLMEGRDDGAIAQLTMGEGKTRVILPMLVLALADGKRVVSLTFLSTLLDEAYAYLHGALCAGVLGRKLFTLPFHRDIELTPTRVRRMRAALGHCMRERGVLLVAPEHRLSLELKWKELVLHRPTKIPATEDDSNDILKQEVAEQLAALLQTPVLSILDESDELLHHRYQLVYACGGKTALVSFEPRTSAIRAVLDSVSVLSNSGCLPLPNAARVLEPPASAAGVGSGSARSEAAGLFCGLRLLSGPELEAALPAFHEQLARRVLEHLPFEFQKLALLLGESEADKERVVACVKSSDVGAEETMGPELLAQLKGPAGGGGGSELYEFVLALRGLLGGGILKHGLTLRNQVDYGIDRRKAGAASTATRARTRMAVPYRAAHMPSERSEYAQPDVALLLTHLAYYYDGLTLPEFTAAVEQLLHGLGKEAAADHYREWLELSAANISDDELARFADVNQLDASSSSQMAAMHRHLRRNTAVVDFWLRFCVLPAETRQYPQRLAASAWDLAAAGARVMGFSGTNDNYRLLPLRVHQAPAVEPLLKATNGRMLDVIIKHTRGFHTLPSAEDAGGTPVWQSLLQAALDNGAHAVIDCGALLAGTSNSRIADYLLTGPHLQHLQQLGFRGVTFFDEQERGWVVLEPTGRCLPRAASPLQEHETFVLYDEARCRGADLKLQRSAVGLLTLGPRVCKDKLMQAAGRLRQLGRGQALCFAATTDIATHVVEYAAAAGAGSASSAASSAAGPSAVDVLAWVMGNTVGANLHGVAQWAAQGLHFASTMGAPERSVQPEVLGLQELYAGSKAPHPVGEVVVAAAKQARLRCIAGSGDTTSAAKALADGGGVAAATKTIAELERLAARYGEGHSVRAGSGADEECERELEQEEEEEQEREKQAPKQQPAPEIDWSYRHALGVTSLEQLQAPAAGMLQPLGKAVAQLDSLDSAQPMSAVPWSDKVHVSRNYLNSIADLPPGQPLNEYLRPVGWLLVLADGAVVLLSEREADQLLAAAWATGAAAGGLNAAATDGPLLVSLTYAWQAVTLPVSLGKPPLLVTNLGRAAARGGAQGSAAAWEQLRRRLGVRQLVSVCVFAGETCYRVRPGIGDGAARVTDAALDAAAQRVAAELRQLVAGRRPQVQQLLEMRGRQSHIARSDLEKAVEGLQLQL
ncbi:hypothetical protein HYH02_003695 [Chlamydomonas schloesseri]|uniref:ubiquitinyl hydrolase 1 n=1 Tax=Chlamydomonas schloesseri TaxID=2026947 RepID=A0A835WSS4_9CHLO|nr:hypothetical protein HYH02_003695 [Chlamydomonas schloesseri]|eukprot:KAG2451920.1 hypothetical protein HYH02_003695 [Chlamydomonas schloesseri]